MCTLKKYCREIVCFYKTRDEGRSGGGGGGGDAAAADTQSVFTLRGETFELTEKDGETGEKEMTEN